MKYLWHLMLHSLLFTSCVFTKKQSHTHFLHAQSKAPYDAIIVPGYPYNGVSWSSTMRDRVIWANYLYTQGIAKNIIYSGGAVYSPYVEAKIMAAYGAAQGIPAAHIFTEINAEHSTENVYYSYVIARKQGFKKVALATDPFQGKSMRKMITKLELPIDIIPILYDTLNGLDTTEPTIIPTPALKEPFISIVDRESLFTRIKGTLGKQIIWYEEDLPNDKTVRKFKKKGRIIEP